MRAHPATARHATLLSSAFALLSMACCAGAPPTFAGAPFYPSGDGHFSVIGDLQGTLPVERLIGREDNDAERWRLTPELARANPAFVVLLGDLVSWGASSAAWEDFDQRTDALRRAGTVVVAVPGNHEYFGGTGLHHYFARMPHLRQEHWYERRYGPLGLIFLDSNQGPLSADEWDEQREWYESALARFDADPNVLGVLVFLHHAPFTNSALVGDDPHVAEAFLPAFVASQKAMAIISGHAHGYERFRKWNKAFIVSGGGGGPRSPLLNGSERRHLDQFDAPPIRNFNFLELHVRERALLVDVVGLPKGESRFCLMEAFELGWPSGDAIVPEWPAEGPPTAREQLPLCYPRRESSR